jgi:mannose-1-phosphate guanylyltransferase
LILAGGFATRLRPLSCSKPKLLFPIVGVPLVESMARWLGSGGVDQIILAVNHLSDRLKIDVGHTVGQVRMVFSVEDKPLGTGGPVRLAAGLLGKGQPFFVANGDIVSNIDVAGMLRLHEERNAEATIALVSVADPSPFGSVLADSGGVVKKFEEKSGNSSVRNLVNAGVYVLSPSVIDSIPPRQAVSLERDVFPKLAESGKMHAWIHDGYWYDIGRISEYIRANKELLEMQEFKDSDRNVGRRKGSRVVSPAYIGKESSVGTHATVGPRTILSNNVIVGERSTIRDSIVFEDTKIGDRTIVEDAVIGEKVVIGKDSRIGNGSIIAGQLNVPAGSVVSPNSVLLC